MYCKYCDSIHLIERPTTFKDGSEHIERVCEECGRHQQYVSYIPNEDYKMPFGKHKGKILTDLPDDYLQWAAKNLNGSIRKRLQQEMARRNDSKVRS